MFANTKYRALLLPTLAVAAVLLALAALLLVPELTQAQSDAPTVTAVAIASDAGDDDTYLLGDAIRITLTFSQAVNVTGAPSLKIDMDPANWGTKQAAYHSGGGSASLVFTHTVVEPNYSTQGIAVLSDSLTLNGGSIQSASSDTDANLSHAGLAHDASHKVDWRQATPTPSVSSVAITSDAGDDDTYAKDDTIQITVTFSEAVNVTGTPQLNIDMDPATWGTKQANYHSGSGSASLVFTHTVVEPNLSTQGIAVLADTLALNGGSIQSAEADTDANLSHAGLAHDASHKVDWQQSPPAPTPTPTPPPVATAPTVTAVAITSDAGDDDTYAMGEVIQVTLTFSQPVSVTSAAVSYLRIYGGPELKIDMDPADGGENWARYQSGSGTNRLSFAHTVIWRNISTDGVAVLANSLRLNGGTIRSAASQMDADLSHAGLDHDPSHLVDSPQSPPAPLAPTVTGVAIASYAGSDNTYAVGDVIDVRLTFNQWFRVTGVPRLKIDLDPGEGGERWATPEGDVEGQIYFAYTVVEPNISTAGVAVLADTLELNGGAIRSASSNTDAVLSHGGLDHDPKHKVHGIKRVPPKIGPGNDPPVCIGSAERIDKRYAPPLLLARYIGIECGDADREELTYSVTSDPPAVAKQVWYDSSINRIWFQPLGHCDLNAITPALPETFTTTVTVTATDPHGASATGTAYFKTFYECPTLVRADGYDREITLTFDIPLNERSTPAPSDFVVKVDGAAVALAETGGVRVDDHSVVLTLAAPVSGYPAVTVSYTPGDNPIQDHPLMDAVDAEAFQDYPVKFPPPRPEVVSVTLVSTPSADTDGDGLNDTYAPGDVARARVTFDSPVDTRGNVSVWLQLDPEVGTKRMRFDSSAGSANTTTLDFTYAVVDGDLAARGIAFHPNALDLGRSIHRYWDPDHNQGATTPVGWKHGIIHATGYGGVRAYLRFSSVAPDPAHKVDGRPPEFQSAAVNATALWFTFNEPLDPASLPPVSAFVITARSGEIARNINVTGGSLVSDGATLTATLESAVLPDERVSLNYIRPDATPLRDAAGNAAESSVAIAFANNTS